MLEILGTIAMGAFGSATISFIVVSTASLLRTRAGNKTTKNYAELTLSQENGRLSFSAEMRAEIEETPEWWQAKYDALLMDVDPEAYAKEHAPDPNRKSWNKYSTAYLLGACDDMHEWMSTNTQALATNDTVTCSRCHGVFPVIAPKKTSDWESIESLNKKMSLPSYESMNATLEQLSKPIVVSEPEPLNRERTITWAREFYKRRIGRSAGYPLYVETKHGEMLIKFHDAVVRMDANGDKTLYTETDMWFESHNGTWSHQTIVKSWPYSHGTAKSYKQGCACMECVRAHKRLNETFEQLSKYNEAWRTR